MFAVLGDIQFDLISYFNSFESQFGADYAEHSVIEGKPRLQFVGDKLNEISIQLVFHQQYCDPEKELGRLKDALESHDAMALVLGNGDYKGWFVLTELQASSKQMDKTGALIALEASITLREYVGDKQNPLPPPAVQTEVPPTDAKTTPTPQPETPATPPVDTNPISGAVTAVANTIRQVVNYANQANSALKVAKEAVDLVKKMKDNPLAALGQVPALVGKIEQIAGPLENLSPALNELSKQIAEVKNIVDAGEAAVGAVRNIKTSLEAMKSSNVSTTIDYVGKELTTIADSLDKAAPSISKLTAKMVTRDI